MFHYFCSCRNMKRKVSARVKREPVLKQKQKMGVWFWFWLKTYPRLAVPVQKGTPEMNSFPSFCNHYVHRKRSRPGEPWGLCSTCRCLLNHCALHGPTKKRCAWMCSHQHTWHLCLLCVERNVPDPTTLEDWSGLTFPAVQSSSGRSQRVTSLPSVRVHKH